MSPRSRPLSLSSSSLGIFRECPRCFWLQFNKNIKRPRGIFSSLPGGLDRILKAYFNIYRQRHLLPPLVADKLEGKLANVSLNLNFTDEENDLRITGRLDDCLELDGGLYAPLDHKTRGKLPESEEYSQRYYQTQMDTYTLLLEKNGHSIKNIAYIVYYSPDQGELHKGFPFKIAVHKLTTHPEVVHQLFLEAKESLARPLPEAATGCEYCRWLKEIKEGRVL